MMQQRSIFRISFGGMLVLFLFPLFCAQVHGQTTTREWDEEVQQQRARVAAARTTLSAHKRGSTNYAAAEAALERQQSFLRYALDEYKISQNRDQLFAGRRFSSPLGQGVSYGVNGSVWTDELPPLRNVPEWDTKNQRIVKAQQELAARALAKSKIDVRDGSFGVGTPPKAGATSAVALTATSEAGGSWGVLPPEEVSTLFKRLKVQASILDKTLLDHIFPGEFKVSERLTLRTESAKRQYLMQQLEKLMTDMTASESEAQKLESLKKFIAKHGWFGRYVQSFAARGEMFDANMAKQTIASGEGLEKVKKMAGSKYELVAALRRHVSGVTPYLSSKAKEGVVGLLFGAVLTAAAQAGEAESIADGAAATSSSAANDRAAFRPEARARRVSK